jgi:hypothetical protein
MFGPCWWEARSQTSFRVLLAPRSQTPGAILYVRRAVADRLSFSSLLRSGVGGGQLVFNTELPVVRECDYFTRSVFDTVALSDATRRTLLRVYDPTGAAGVVRVDVETGLCPTATRTLTFSPPHRDATGLVLQPGHTQLPLGAETLPELAGCGSGHVRVTSVNGQPIWALVSMADNLTHQVQLRRPDPGSCLRRCAATTLSAQ